MNTVETDTARYYQQADRQDAMDAEVEASIIALVNRYWREYMKTGRIADLDLDEREITFLACQKSVSSHRLIVEHETRKAVDEAPRVYLPELYARIDWD